MHVYLAFVASQTGSNISARNDAQDDSKLVSAYAMSRYINQKDSSSSIQLSYFTTAKYTATFLALVNGT